jgi:phenylacetate-CoA ligase
MSTSAALTSLLDGLDRLAQGDTGALAVHQNARLQALHDHHAQASGWYRERLRRAGLTKSSSLDAARLRHLAPIARADLQAQGDAAFVQPPAAHGAARVTQTSGSSGEPVRVMRTELSHRYWMAYNLREHLWWQRDFSQSLFVVRANLGQRFVAQKDWGPPVSLLHPTGPGYAASLGLSTTELAQLLIELAPGYVLLYPSVLKDLLALFRVTGAAPRNLLQIRTMGETLGAALREEAEAALGVPVADTYSSQELGVIAVQCPRGEGYHLMAENLIVEVLRPDGSACAEGESGDVVVTDLHNFATPLVRYAIGDVAVAGGACRCGCRLPMLQRIEGRSRSLITYPDGRKRWPLVGFARFREVAPIAQYQVVQHDIETLELKLACARLTTAQEAALTSIVTQALGHTFALRLTYHPRGIARLANGKFEEVVSLIEAQTDEIEEIA